MGSRAGTEGDADVSHAGSSVREVIEPISPI